MITIPSELDNVLDFTKPGLPQLKDGATKKQQKIYIEWKKHFEDDNSKKSNKFRMIEY